MERMNKFKVFTITFIILIACSCSKNINNKENNNNVLENIEYPKYSISEYNQMDKYEISKNMDDIKYNYIYFFKDDSCVNAKEVLTFKTSENAKAFYEENKSNEEYLEINLDNSIITYYYNPEYFEYLMYPKDILIELLNSVIDDE